MFINYKVLDSKYYLPSKGSPNAAAYDLYSIENYVLLPGETHIFKLGFAVAIPRYWKGEIYSRSGLASKGIAVLNAPGKIDSDYRGEVGVILHNHSEVPYTINMGDRIAQFEINPVHELEFSYAASLPETDRGDGGFGSTGK